MRLYQRLKVALVKNTELRLKRGKGLALKDGVSREVRDDSLNGVEGIVIFIHVDICQATPRRLEGCRRSAEQENLQPFLLDRQKDSNYYAD